MPFTNSPDIQKAQQEDYPKLVDVLIKAFDADPHISWLVRSDEHRETAYRQFFTMMLNGLAQPYGEIYTSGDLNSVALWYPPGRGKIGLLKQAEVAPAFIGAVGWRNLLSRMMGIEKMEYHHPQEPHYYLQLLGVDPGHQGKGSGRALLKSTLMKCDAQQTFAYLETANPKNVGYYEAFGFQVIHSMQMPDKGPKLWMMKRMPRPQETAPPPASSITTGHGGASMSGIPTKKLTCKAPNVDSDPKLSHVIHISC